MKRLLLWLFPAPDPESRLLVLLGSKYTSDETIRAAAADCRGSRDLSLSLTSEWVIDMEQGRRELARRKRLALEVLR